MDLRASERDALRDQLIALLDFDEPEAILATLCRVAERKGMSAARAGKREAVERWENLAAALRAVDSGRADLPRPRITMTLGSDRPISLTVNGQRIELSGRSGLKGA